MPQVLEEHHRWLTKELTTDFTECICQCGSEDAISASSNPARMRAELLSYVFFCQFIYTHYSSHSRQFKEDFPGPYLRGHSFGGHASPSWLIYRGHGFDKLADWSLIRAIFNDYSTSTYEWLISNEQLSEEEYTALIEREVKREFPGEQHRLLLGADD